MTHSLRRLLFSTVAVSTAVVLVACGGGSSNDASEVSEETTTSKVANELVDSPPTFDKPEERFSEIEAEGCGPMMEEWGHDMAIFLSFINEGTWESVATEFTPTTVAENQNACEIKVTNSGIENTPGGDANNYSVTVTALTADNNPIDTGAVNELWQLREGEEKSPEISPDQLANTSPLLESSYAFATAQGDPEFNGTFRSQKTMAEGFFQVGDTQVAAYTEVPYPTEEDPQPQGGAWAAVTTDEEQLDTKRNSGSAARQLANVITWRMNNALSASQDKDYYRIQDNERF